MFITYKNLSLNSLVCAYEIHDTFIVVEYRKPTKAGNRFYKYSHVKPGMDEVNKLKNLL